MIHSRSNRGGKTIKKTIIKVTVIVLGLIIGIFIFAKITNYQANKNEVYKKAVRITDSKMFQAGINANIGNVFVYGELEPVDTVSFDEIDGEYLYIKKVKEQYRSHTRIQRVGNVSFIQPYQTWDKIDSEIKKCDKIKFCGIVLQSKKIKFPDADYIGTIKETGNLRYRYYGVPLRHTGTIYTKLKNGDVSNNSVFFEGQTIDETVEKCTSEEENITFLIIWIPFVLWCAWAVSESMEMKNFNIRRNKNGNS